MAFDRISSGATALSKVDIKKTTMNIYGLIYLKSLKGGKDNVIKLFASQCPLDIRWPGFIPYDLKIRGAKQKLSRSGKTNPAHFKNFLPRATTNKAR